MAILWGHRLATEEAWRRVLGRQQRLWPVVMIRPSGSSVALLRRGGSSCSHSRLVLTVGLPTSAFPGCPVQSPHPLDGEEGVMASRRGRLCQSSARGPGLRTCRCSIPSDSGPGPAIASQAGEQPLCEPSHRTCAHTWVHVSWRHPCGSGQGEPVNLYCPCCEILLP